jgi:hypothetical protein
MHVPREHYVITLTYINMGLESTLIPIEYFISKLLNRKRCYGLEYVPYSTKMHTLFSKDFPELYFRLKGREEGRRRKGREERLGGKERRERGEGRKEVSTVEGRERVGSREEIGGYRKRDACLLCLKPIDAPGTYFCAPNHGVAMDGAQKG